MEAKVKSMGHPIHPMMVSFPLGLLTTSVIFDIVHFTEGNGYWSEIAFWMITAGLVGGLLSAMIGTVDWLAIPSGTRAKKIGIWHGAGNYLILAMFVVSWFLRLHAMSNPSVVAYVFSFLGTGLLGITGWLGGELVLRMGIGVDEGANLNAPSSLSGLPADASHVRESSGRERSLIS